MHVKRALSVLFSSKGTPIVLLCVFILAFGLLSPWLGFYQDDWHFIFYAYTRGLGKLWELSTYDNRPFASWPYIIGFAILGFRPLAWQITVVVIRWLTTVIFWMIYRSLWPRHERIAASASLLFAVYPLYTLQSMAVTYITHWVCFFLFGLSLLLMVHALQKPKKLWPLLAISMAVDVIQLFTIEYFCGLEFLRPLILWLTLSKLSKSKKETLRKTFLYWLPYLLVLVAFIIWRGFVFESPASDTNSPFILKDLFTSPLPTLAYLATAIFKDIAIIQVGSWANTVQPALINLTSTSLLFLAIGLASLLGSAFFLKNLQPKDGQGKPDRIIIFQALTIGLLSLILGPIPAWTTGQPLYDSNPLWNSRLGMASMFGAALVIASLLEWMVRTRNQGALVCGLLIGLSVNYLLHIGNDYRHAWNAEVNFLSQLTWRAPSIQPETPVTSAGEMLSLMGDYPTAFAMNVMYKQPNGSDHTVLWYFPTDGNDHIAEAITTGQNLASTKFTAIFRGNGSDSIAISFRPDVASCLHIFDPSDSQSHLYSDTQRQLALVSNIGRIESTPTLNDSFIQQAFGTHSLGWCYYYQNAELAVQNENWEDAIKLWKAAQNKALKPSYGSEFFPFIRAYLETQQWSDAQKLTATANEITSSQAMRQASCTIWETNRQIKNSPEGAGIQASIFKSLQCTP